MQLFNELINLKLIPITRTFYSNKFQFPVALGYFTILPFGSPIKCQHYSNFGVDWFVDRMIEIKKDSTKYFKPYIPLQITPGGETQFQQSNIHWLCEQPFSIYRDCE